MLIRLPRVVFRYSRLAAIPSPQPARHAPAAGTLPAALITALLACMLAALWFLVLLTRREEKS
jgi:hypothetical protein